MSVSFICYVYSQLEFIKRYHCLQFHLWDTDDNPVDIAIVVVSVAVVKPTCVSLALSFLAFLYWLRYLKTASLS